MAIIYCSAADSIVSSNNVQPTAPPYSNVQFDASQSPSTVELLQGYDAADLTELSLLADEVCTCYILAINE